MTITVETEMEMAADLAREDLREMAARVDSVETETVMAREDLQDREIPRTEDHVRVMEATVDFVRVKAVTIEKRKRKWRQIWPGKTSGRSGTFRRKRR